MKTKAPDRYYFDHNATTPVSSEVLDVYTGLLKGNFGNASSIHHYGQEAKNRLDRARKQARVDRVMSWSKVAAPLEEDGSKAANADVIARTLGLLGVNVFSGSTLMCIVSKVLPNC